MTRFIHTWLFRHTLKPLILVFPTLYFTLSIEAQDKGYYTRYYSDKFLKKQAAEWCATDQWRQGFTGASPHRSVNLTEFYRQYQKNPTQWEALFKWLATTDLVNIPKGRHPIEGTTLTASVEDSHNEPLEKRRSESHSHHIDFQYVVKGTERFGLIDHYTSTPDCKYDARKDVIHYSYDKGRTQFYDSTPDRFFIFFPGDWHIAKVNNDSGNQDIRVIVIKVDYID